jgi:hypothetical protein
LKQLEQKGVVRIERDRFEILGGRDGRLFLKYAAKRHTGKKLRYRDTYPVAATIKCASHLTGAILSGTFVEARVLSSGLSHELGGTVVGGWLDFIGDASANQDVVQLADELGPWLDAEDVQRSDEFLLLGLQLQAGLHDVEHAELLANVESRPLEEVQEALVDWIATHEALLAKYDMRVVRWRCEEVTSDALRTAVAYWDLRLAGQVSYQLYRAGAFESAEHVVETNLETSKGLVGTEPKDPLLRTEFASVLMRLGFMAATRSDWEIALERLNASRSMALVEEWLVDYDLGYVHARQGDLMAAREHVASALEKFGEDKNQSVLLHAYFPTNSDWIPQNESWNIVELHGTWITRFLELQLIVLRALEAPASEVAEELEAAVNTLSGSAPPALLRLGGWASFTILGKSEAAAALFTQAAMVTSYDRADVPRAEAAHAEGTALPKLETSGIEEGA